MDYYDCTVREANYCPSHDDNDELEPAHDDIAEQVWRWATDPSDSLPW